MIIAAIIVLAAVVIVALYGILSSMPLFNFAVVADVLAYVMPYLEMGRDFLYSITYPSVVIAMFSVTVAVEAVVLAYKVAMWVATKIPMFGVSD